MAYGRTIRRLVDFLFFEVLMESGCVEVDVLTPHVQILSPLAVVLRSKSPHDYSMFHYFHIAPLAVLIRRCVLYHQLIQRQWTHWQMLEIGRAHV